MNQVRLFGTVCIFFTMFGEILPLNYAPEPKFGFLPRAAVLPENSESPLINESIPDFPLASIMPRKTGRAYTILYPLTFENRGGKSLNITLQQPQPPADDDQIQSRVMNQPKLYPNFQFDFPLYNKVGDPVSSKLPPSSSDEYDDSDTPPIGSPPSSNQYNAKPSNFEQPPAPPAPPTYDKNYQLQPPAYDKSYQSQPPTYDRSYQSQPPAYDKSYLPQPPPSIPYNLKSPRLASLSPAAPQSSQSQFFDKNIAFIAYLPLLRQNKTKGHPRSTAPSTTTTSTTTQKPKSPPVPPQFTYSKNTVPKYKILPLQAYNKATYVSRPVTPPSTTSKLQQQYVTCICVPYYLCKDGVINSGGRLQAINKRTSRSLKSDFFNKTLPAISVQPKTAGSFTNSQSTEPSACEKNEICCQINFGDNIDDGNYYPVATPPPEPSYNTPPRFPDKTNQYDVCGVRKVYGVQRRLKQLQYTADVAEFGEYPWQVAILKKVVGDKNLYLCGGVLIAPQWIATVAHCIKKDKTSPLLVRLGEWDVNRKDETYPYIEKDVTTIVLHPEFNPESLENDLALIRIIAPVDPRIPHITPACLPYPGQVFDNQKCWVSGWGKDFFGPKGAYQNVLKEVDVPVVSRALCSTELRSTNLGPDFKLHPGFLCAGGEEGKDACTGDGGSPLVCTSNGYWYVVGLVSWGIGCGQPGIPGVYVNVLYYSDWINSVTRR
ncbi:unnamed protein product [Larinioides sclopetarius]